MGYLVRILQTMSYNKAHLRVPIHLNWKGIFQVSTGIYDEVRSDTIDEVLVTLPAPDEGREDSIRSFAIRSNLAWTSVYAFSIAS